MISKPRFNPEQSSFKEFARKLKDRYDPVVVWAGSGVSVSGGCPSWPKLRDFAREQAELKVNGMDGPLRDSSLELLKQAERSQSLWESFSYLKRVLGETTFPTVVRDAFSGQAKQAPAFYSEMWKLGVRGFVTTNIDRFAAKGATTAKRAEVEEFDGFRCGQYGFVLQKQVPFVLNVHGRLESDSTWIFTAEDLQNLQSGKAYWTFLETLFRVQKVLFVGCSPDDPAVAAHLTRFRGSGLELDTHYWLTHRKDREANLWAEENRVNRIYFEASGSDFSGVDEFVAALKRFTSIDAEPPIVVPSVPFPTSEEAAPSATELLREPSVNRVREILNRHAKKILTLSGPRKDQLYRAFTEEYEEALHRAWFISANQGAEFFDLVIQRSLKKGAFGQVYVAIDEHGREVALKVLHGNVKDDPAMLTCFRRGVEAMRLLAENKVAGVVPYLKAWEIPTCALMDFIDGVNLQEAVERNQVKDWSEILRVSSAIAHIIKSAHSTPAGVLHRDLRPANIMFDSADDVPTRNILVLDFDLCWHQDAVDGASLTLDREANNGYLAPEQVDRTRHNQTRKPLVDSFGFGMIMYYLLARRHPLINQYMFTNWITTLNDLANSKPCKEWQSVPYRFIRVIANSTRDAQISRWDMSRIHAELSILESIVRGKRQAVSAEMFAEELFARIKNDIGNYEHRPDRTMLVNESREGFETELCWNEPDRTVSLVIRLLQTGSYHFESLRKYVGESADLAVRALKEGQWVNVSKAITTGSVVIEGSIPTKIVFEDDELTSAAIALKDALLALRKLSARASAGNI